LAKVLEGNRISVPDDFLPANPKINDVIEEVFK
jgi:hypothetical protein